ncbi:PREDICTED: RNA polymerase II subunit A C-terminal domain phosphatase SSU72-like [Amphimedon queenslandica]|uniref:RNA polymerase II subunit A C-terminal domain phosphatase SSU72 n=1 Tax=Amphimedon queenslandica TaxID=400682 RepID=A0A1X7TW91_AMPQE|nr:PREDICTED: RNA polymerase II subunit A C-terminal domain phosphatase SSU72-like [Amphimedon queenslandica]|eukprot:XP_003389608.1 PREDICTED: RNA polymerase II subunit A C-terminal domain phosphatase SSU72-like [Amphimedon queenslandica]
MESLRFAVVCSSNQNRSMEAHHLLNKRGYNVKSYGIGSVVKLPGASANEPIIYPFGTTYEDMYQDLYQRDPHLYTQNGILQMLDRNRRIKPSPERFQEATEDKFNIIFTVGEKIFDTVIDDIESRGPQIYSPVHVININIQDNLDEATFGSFLFCEMCEMMSDSEDLDNEIELILLEFEAKHTTRTVLHSITFY